MMKYSFSNCSLDEVIVHLVGNIHNSELVVSKSLLQLDESSLIALQDYFVKSFNTEELFSFSHDTNLSMNEVYCYVRKIFHAESSILEESGNLARFLYEQSRSPQIKTGEFYVAHFSNCFFDGRQIQGLGLFKSETKEVFLEVAQKGESFYVKGQKGVNINKLDKGVFVFDVDEETGYQVLVVDNTSRRGDTQFWVDEFLHITRRKNNYTYTMDCLKMAKGFIQESYGGGLAIPRAEQVRVQNETVRFFKENDVFDLKDYERQVLIDTDIIEKYHQYKEAYSSSHNRDVADSFPISDAAYKRQARSMRSIIKLDKNFHIYIHGGEKRIRKGYDEETGLSYYQLFFEDEA